MRDTVERALQQFPAVLVTGPRQSGKTTFLLERYGDRAAYVSFDDPLERGFARDDPEGLLNRFGDDPAILDEIQHVPELLERLKLRIDRDRQRTGRYVLTGSQQFELMRGVSESLAGRIAILELLPFSILEHPPTDLAAALWLGGYPDPALHPDKRDLWVSSYLRTYVERDVRLLRDISNLRAFEQFVALAAARHGQVFNKAALARDCGISQPTAKAWGALLEQSYLATLLSPYHRNYGKRLTRSPKLYFLDPALVCALTRQPSGEAAIAGPMGGPLLEGLVVAEAIKGFANAGRSTGVWFWRTRGGHEVDLLVELGGKLHPVEVKLTATPTARHVDPLSEFCELVGEDAADAGLLVCRVREETPLPGGHRAIPWTAFPSWLARHLA